MTKQDTTTVKKWKITLVGWKEQAEMLAGIMPTSEVYYVEAIFKSDAISIAKERSKMTAVETSKATTSLKLDDMKHFQSLEEQVETIEKEGKEQAMENFREFEKEREERLLELSQVVNGSKEETEEVDIITELFAIAQRLDFALARMYKTLLSSSRKNVIEGDDLSKVVHEMQDDLKTFLKFMGIKEEKKASMETVFMLQDIRDMIEEVIQGEIGE